MRATTGLLLVIAGCGGVALSSAPVSRPAMACVGDCDGDGAVTVDEMLTLIAISHGEVALSGCPAGDMNGDGAVTVDELILASQAMQGECGCCKPTPAPTKVPVGQAFWRAS